MSKLDLHLHSTASDGKLSPAEVVRKAAEADLAVIALADHDTVDGIVPALEAAKTFPPLKVIPAVEISTDIPKGELHLLGYFIDYTDPNLQSTLQRMRHSREGRAEGMITKLRNMGVLIELERVKEIAGTGSIGRPHIAQAMLEKGYIASIKEAFTKYIGWGGPAYVEREKMTPGEAVELISQAKGLPVLAHPLTITDPEAMIIELLPAGLVGIEAYYDGYTTEEKNKLVSLTDRYGLIATGGSDFHGLDAATETMIGGVEMPEDLAERLTALAEQRAKKLASP